MYVYVTMSHDYADEFDVDCCFVETKEQFDKTMADIKKKFEEGGLDGNEFYFGTNEYLSFDSFEDFEGGVDVQECSKEFFDEFRRLNNNASVGYCVIDRML